MKYTGVAGYFVLLAFLVVGSNGAVLAQSSEMRVNLSGTSEGGSNQNDYLPTVDEAGFPYCSGVGVTGRYGPSLSRTVLATNFVPDLDAPVCIAVENVGQDQKAALNYNIGAGNEELGAVDWVLVELRSVPTGTTASEVNRATRLVQKPGLLLSNGIIVDAEDYVNASTDVKDACLQLTDPQDGGCDDLLLTFPGNAFTEGNDTYVVVRHRFHLDIMSANPVDSGSGADLTQLSAVYLGSQALQVVDEAAGVGSMVSGDADGNNEVDVLDITAGYTNAFRDEARFTYHVGDADMNAEVDVLDITAGYTNAFSKGFREGRVPGDLDR